MDKYNEKTLSTEKIFSGRIIDVQIDEVELPNGKKSKREIVKHPGAVAIIALTPEGKILMVKQFRKPLERSLVEIPAGKLEKDENPKSCAARELEEETGYCSDHIEYVQSFYTSPGFANEIIHLHFTDQLTKGRQQTDEDEFVDVLEVTLEEAIQMVESKEIYDAKTAFAVQFLQLKGVK